MAARIHETAIVEDGARLGEDVVVGAYSCVGPGVELGDGVEIKSHVVVAGSTRVGQGCRMFPFASIGQQPQDLKYRGEPSRLEIGENNTIREYVTMNPGTEGGGMVTRVGNGCAFMVGAHVAHDCIIGDSVIMANYASLGGHVCVGDHAIIGGLAAVHQFVRIGRHAMIGGMSGVEHDVIPYGSVMGDRAALCGLNIIGLKRRGFSRASIRSMRDAYRRLFEPQGTLKQRVAQVGTTFAETPEVMDIVNFMAGESIRSFCLPREDRGS
ncbi:MAG: acyl-ACP--UDP-N-acetylglucosamine O-acyltransferase [Alphaproteobacteria bacterium]|nr:acyl-ACP--UDP-N-acetylglucosamine O-acyltransferase [Alphaproteobacteria bacterium]MCY4498863.1 acyl-ACP--UDP-N-acetylglucosamine O-acyltransferase [Rhodospirillaceae bacterium]